MADVEAVIQERLGELDVERSRLEAALAALRNTSGAGRRSPAAGSTTRRTNRKTSKRAKPGKRRAQVLDYLKKSPGATSAEIAHAVGVSSNQMHALMRRLHAEKLVIKRGRGYRLSSKIAGSTDKRTRSSAGRSRPSSRSKSPAAPPDS